MNKAVIYSFHDFRLDTRHHKLFRDTSEIHLSQKEWLLLLAFLQNPEQVISKQSLSEAAWEGRFVSDSSLYKQIQRLRKKLESEEKKESIIKTVHGIGFELVGSVEIIEPDETVQTTIATKPHKSRWWLYALPLFVLIGTYMVFWYSQPDDSISVIAEAEASPISIAILPELQPTLVESDQMAIGGMYYLIHRFKNLYGLSTTRISSSDIRNKDMRSHAIDMRSKGEIEASLVFDLKEEDGVFSSTVQLKGQNGLNAEKQFSASSVKDLFDQVEQWSSQMLTVKAQANGTSISSENRYAVENYIRAMSAQFSGDAALAIKFLELAVREDSKFWLAWYELAISERKQGNYEKGLSILTTLENTRVSSRLSLMVMNAKIITLWRLGRLEEALTTADTAISSSKNEKKYQLTASLLINKAIIHSQLDDLQAAEDAVLEAIEIRENMDQTGASMGAAYNTLAGINQRMGKLDIAVANSNKALEYFRKAGDKRYTTNTQGRLASIYLMQGQYARAKTLILENLATRVQLQDVPGQISSLLKLQDIYRNQGDLSKAQTELNTIETLITQINQRSQHNNFHRAHVRLAYITGDYENAKAHLQRIQPQTDAEQVGQTILAFDYHWYHKDIEVIETELDKLVTLPETSEHALITFWRARLASHKGQNKIAGDLLAQARAQAISSHRSVNIELTFNESLQHWLKTDPAKGQQLFTEFEQFNPSPYPYYRHKAQILFALDQQFAAASLMQELKTRAAELWTAEDETLLQNYQQGL
ncbi:tetratricopeptide repeat protein [Marinicella sp. W31]|uniref:tetratricopeptide repeat protein n=1 Tax=Marinicella sp. W31 TaxID=3023713 RepID=UPI0037574D39